MDTSAIFDFIDNFVYTYDKGDGFIDALYFGEMSFDDIRFDADRNKLLKVLGENTTNEVGRKKANNFDLYDMCGNVQELCWNWYTSTYDTTLEGGMDPLGANLGTNRVIRGGSWGTFIAQCAVSTRSSVSPYNCRSNIGFRVVRSAA